MADEYGRATSCMNDDKAFVDTNVFVYAVDAGSAGKGIRAQSLLADLGCRRWFSEDLQHGREFGNVRVENPFR